MNRRRRLGCLLSIGAFLAAGCSRDAAAPGATGVPSAAGGSAETPTARASGTAAPSASPTGGLAVGDLAPDFSLPGSDGKVHKLSDHRGKEAVVVAWFPKAFTGG